MSGQERDALPPLPEPVLYEVKPDMSDFVSVSKEAYEQAPKEWRRRILFTADQMHAHAMAARGVLPASVPVEIRSVAGVSPWPGFASVQAPQPAAPAVPEVDHLAQFIRQADGNNRLGAAALAEKICEWLREAGQKNPPP